VGKITGLDYTGLDWTTGLTHAPHSVQNRS